MADRVIVQINTKELIVTLEQFHEELKLRDGQETVSLRALEKMALKKTLPGAFRPTGSRTWFVNKLAFLQVGLEFKVDEESESEKAPAPAKGKGKCGDGGKQIPSPDSPVQVAPLRHPARHVG